MTSGSVRFGGFVLDATNRRLLSDGVPVELSGRYFDALVLMVGEASMLVSKDRFMDEVWSGIPVTDEALTQCIKTLRRALGDDAARPRFIETVPKHGYRFVATVELVESNTPAPVRSSLDWRKFFQLGGAGVVGGGLAGFFGGIIYGFGLAGQTGAGAASAVLVLTALCVLVALVGAAGVSFGIAYALVRGGSWQWYVAGGALGGLLVGGIVRLLGLDAFNLLLGASPANITGALEGAALGGAVGLGVWLGRNGLTLARFAAPAALVSGLAGMAIAALGGQLMAGSLALLAQILPQSRLRLDGLGAFLGDEGFGLLAQMVSASLEGTLFGGFIAGAMLLARRQLMATP